MCGGAARDILLSRGRIIPRDLDIVFRYVSLEDICSVFHDYLDKMTRFGGLSLKAKDWTIHMWPLSETWAFKQKHIEGKGLSDFVKTTFLDIEAIAVQLFSRKKQKREIYSKGFFEAIIKKTIEINLEDNPYPAVCIVRSLAVANRFKFAIGPRLAKYIVHYSSQTEPEELVKIYRDRYQIGWISPEELDSYIRIIREQLRVSDKQPVSLFGWETESCVLTRPRRNEYRRDNQYRFAFE